MMTNAKYSDGSAIHHREQRGAALILVLVAVSISLVLGMTFLDVSSTSRATTFVVANSTQAHAIAESGLEMALAIIATDPNWRTDVSEGVWLEDIPFGAGSFTVSLFDGYDTNGDGVIEGDGDPADNAGDPITIQSVGMVDGMTVAATAVYFLGGSQSTIATIEKIEIKDKGIIDSYNSLAGPYGPDNQGESAFISSNDVGKPNVKFESGSLIDGDFLFPPNSDPLTYAFDKNDGTLTGQIGELTMEAVDMTTPEPPEMAGNPKDESINTFTVLDEDLYCKKWTLADNGVLKVVGDVTILATDSVQLKGQIWLDNPKFGNTSESGSSQQNVAGIQIATPITIAQQMEATSVAVYTRREKKLRMAIYDDDDGKPGTLLAQTNEVRGQANNLHWVEALLPTTSLVPGQYWLSVSFEDSQQVYRYQNTLGGPDADVHYRTHNARVNGFLAEWGTSNSTHHRTASMFITANVPGQGATLTIYATNGDFDISNNAIINGTTKDPSRLVIYYLNDDAKASMILDKQSATYAHVWAPNSELKLKDDARLYGRVRASNLKLENKSRIDADTSGGTADPGVAIDNLIEIKKDSVIGSMDGGSAVLSCNSVGKSVIKLSHDAILKGSAFGGPGGAGGNSEVKVGSNALITGETGNLSEEVDISLPPTPSILPSIGDAKYNGGTTTLSSSFTCKKFEMNNNAVVNIEGDVTIVVTEDVKFEKKATLNLMPGASLTLYCQKKPVIQNEVALNLNGDPARFVIYYSHKDKVEVKNTAQIAASIIAPEAEIKIKDKARWYGSLLCKKLKIEKEGRIHQDQAGGGNVIVRVRR